VVIGFSVNVIENIISQINYYNTGMCGCVCGCVCVWVYVWVWVCLSMCEPQTKTVGKGEKNLVSAYSTVYTCTYLVCKPYVKWCC